MPSMDGSILPRSHQHSSLKDNDISTTINSEQSRKISIASVSDTVVSDDSVSDGTNTVLQKKMRKRKQSASISIDSINYKGVNFYSACSSGNFPLVVLLW